TATWETRTVKPATVRAPVPTVPTRRLTVSRRAAEVPVTVRVAPFPGVTPVATCVWVSTMGALPPSPRVRAAVAMPPRGTAPTAHRAGSAKSPSVGEVQVRSKGTAVVERRVAAIEPVTEAEALTEVACAAATALAVAVIEPPKERVSPDRVWATTVTAGV